MRKACCVCINNEDINLLDKGQLTVWALDPIAAWDFTYVGRARNHY